MSVGKHKVFNTGQRSAVIPLFAIAAVITVSLTYFQWSSAWVAEALAVKTAGQTVNPMTLERVAGNGGFSFDTHETPRELPDVSFMDGEGLAMTLFNLEP